MTHLQRYESQTREITCRLCKKRLLHATEEARDIQRRSIILMFSIKWTSSQLF